MVFNEPMYTGLSQSYSLTPMGMGGVATHAPWGGCFPASAYPLYANYSMGYSCQWLGGMPFGVGGQSGMPFGYGDETGMMAYAYGLQNSLRMMASQAFGTPAMTGGFGTPAMAGGPGQVGDLSKGGWSDSKGGYVVGESGRLQIDLKGGESSSDSMVQYRTEGGEWKDLDRAKSGKGSSKWIDAEPGSTVEFRIKTEDDKIHRAGSTDNADKRDHGRTTVTDKGVKLAFEDWTDNDFNDAEIEISDAKPLGT